MEKIQMVDLQNQYKNIKQDIDNAIQKVINNANFIKGAEVFEFEKKLEKYLNTKHVISCANGTDALQIALMSLNLNEGDEIITTSFTFVATLEVIALLKLKPIIVDINKDSFCIDTSKIEEVITSKTKAIIPIHLFGQAANMDIINNIAKKNNLFIIEDCAQAIGSNYKDSRKLGTIGDIGCTSFFPSKNLGCFGDGGALFTNNNKLANKIRGISNHGMKTKYEYNYIGINSRLDTLQAAILNVKLKKLDSYCKARQKVAEFYNNAFALCKEIETPYKVDYSSHVYHQYTLKISENKRDALKNYLTKFNIPSMVYYPYPLHTQPAYANFGYKQGDFPNVENTCKKVISLPIHTELNEEQLNYITNTVLNFNW